MIKIDGNTVLLRGRGMSYVMYVNECGDLLNFHFGRELTDEDYSEMKSECEESLGYTSNVRSLDVYPQEYPEYGHSDLRNPCLR